MYLIKQTNVFSKWLSKLKDIKGKVSILRRIDRMKEGNFGDYKSISINLYELRLITGPGYRVYYTKQESEVIILLIGGDKSSQSEDIKKAKRLLEELENE
jgi:putative addiction module killer protein